MGARAEGDSLPAPTAVLEESDSEEAEGAGPDRSGREKAKGFQLRPGVYHVPAATVVRLVRLHRWRSGMFEVFEFKDEALQPELRDRVLKQGGWRDEERQWYDLVEGSKAERFEVLRRTAQGTQGLSWEGWVRLGSRYTPARACSGCGASFRHADEQKTLCGLCLHSRWEGLDQAIEALLKDVEEAKKLPKGGWQQLKDLRESIDRAEKEKLFSRARVVRLRQKLHPVYRALIDRRREEQEGYRSLLAELEGQVKAVVEHSFASDKPERSVVEDLKRLRIELRRLSDEKKLGIREFRRFIDELRRASEREEQKFTAHRQLQEARQRTWAEGERAISEQIDSIEVGFEHSPDNWQKLLSLCDTINQKAEKSEIGSQGRRRLLDLVNRLMDQEGNLRDMARQDAAAKRQVKKETSRKRASGLKKSVNKISIGLAFSQEVWVQLVGIQREAIRMKNEGGISPEDFREVLAQVNEKLDTLKKLKGWSKQG